MASSSSYHECVKNVGLHLIIVKFLQFLRVKRSFVVETPKTDVFTFDILRHFSSRCRTKPHLHIKDV